jgi:hypothetical protein
MRVTAHFFSILFHPLLILTYMSLLLLWTNPFAFGWRHVSESGTLMIIIIMTTVTLPGIAVVMMKMLGWVSSFSLEDQKERIGPYIAAGLMYLSLYLHLSEAESFPVSLRIAVLGTLIGLWGCFFINNFTKVSVHAAGMGGLVALVVLIKVVFGYDQAQIGLMGGYNLSVPVTNLVYTSIVLAGIVCTSRLILKAHVIKEVYLGIAVGVTSITVAYYFLHSV